MKKLLAILGAAGLTLTPSVNVVSCNSGTKVQGWTPDAKVEGIKPVQAQGISVNQHKSIILSSTNNVPITGTVTVTTSDPDVVLAGINQTNKKELILIGVKAGSATITLSYPETEKVTFTVDVVDMTQPYIMPVKDQVIQTNGTSGSVKVKINIENKQAGSNIQVTTEPPKNGANIYPQKEAITTATVNGDSVTFNWDSSKGYGQDKVTIRYGMAKPVTFKLSVYQKQYLENPPGKDKSFYYDWKEANPNRSQSIVIDQEQWNGFTYFAPYIDAALYSGDNVSEILSQNPNLDHMTFAFAAQDQTQTDKLDISFAGIAKHNAAYDWYVDKKLKQDILQPLVNANQFKNTKVSYGGFNAGQDPEKFLPWVMANKIHNNNAIKAQKELETALVNFQKELADIVSQPMAKSIDFDIEGNAQKDEYKQDTRLLAQTLANMVKNDREWDFSLTVAVLPDGLVAGPNKGLQVLDSFIEEYANANVPIEYLPKINPMVMDYGNDVYEQAINDQLTNADLAISAMEGTKNQLKASIKKFYNQDITDRQAYSLMGCTPMIGVNDTEKGVFTLEDAKEVYNWAQRVGVSYVSMWSMNDDRGLSYPVYEDPNFPGGVLGGQPANKSQTSHGLLYLNEYDFTKVFTGDWTLVK